MLRFSWYPQADDGGAERADASRLGTVTRPGGIESGIARRYFGRSRSDDPDRTGPRLRRPSPSLP